ncbi:hypothetical protein FB567DRAFT_519658 [Paraphoma chrysanthemicola]|uniref:Secreted protein n=1 Tax=Paraphoma chrysanthemicola TaxID=798071 RepID=A0A8K0RCZ7_9PLEO|nr:hypothetical protein FB567DRAFT_519658 [Paraphoma chrysanthemicola]
MRMSAESTVALLLGIPWLACAKLLEVRQRGAVVEQKHSSRRIDKMLSKPLSYYIAIRNCPFIHVAMGRWIMELIRQYTHEQYHCYLL